MLSTKPANQIRKPNVPCYAMTVHGVHRGGTHWGMVLGPFLSVFHLLCLNTFLFSGLGGALIFLPTAASERGWRLGLATNSPHFV